MKAICIEFEGVIYDGDYDANDPFSVNDNGPKAGSLQALANYVKDFEVHITSPRLKWSKAGRLSILSWLKHHGCPQQVYGSLKFLEAPSFALILSAKAMKFDNTFPGLTPKQD